MSVKSVGYRPWLTHNTLFREAVVVSVTLPRFTAAEQWMAPTALTVLT